MLRGDFSEKQKGTRAKEKKKYHKTFFLLWDEINYRKWYTYITIF